MLETRIYCTLPDHNVAAAPDRHAQRGALPLTVSSSHSPRRVQPSRYNSELQIGKNFLNYFYEQAIIFHKDELRNIFESVLNHPERPILDPRAQEHVDRVTDIAMGIATSLGNDIEKLSQFPPQLAMLILEFGAKLHDQGKSGWPEAILDIFATITREQFDLYVMPHPTVGSSMIQEIASKVGQLSHWSMLHIIKIIEGHHVKWDPKKFGRVGYPENHGQQSFLTSIVTIADSFDAMLFRPYSRLYHKLDECYKEVLKCMTTGEFNIQLQEAFIHWFNTNKTDLEARCALQAQQLDKERVVGDSV